MVKLSKANIRKAWKMKGTTRKNALKRAWALQKGKRKSSKSRKSSKKTKKTSNTRTTRSSQSRGKGGSRNTSKKRTRIPTTLIVGNMVAIFGEPNPGWSSTADNFKEKRFDQAIQSYIAAWTGLRIGPIGGQRTTEIDIVGVLNPTDMRNAPALKAAIATKLITKLTKKFGINPISKIPILKDWISWS